MPYAVRLAAKLLVGHEFLDGYPVGTLVIPVKLAGLAAGHGVELVGMRHEAFQHFDGFLSGGMLIAYAGKLAQGYGAYPRRALGGRRRAVIVDEPGGMVQGKAPPFVFLELLQCSIEFHCVLLYIYVIL